MAEPLPVDMSLTAAEIAYHIHSALNQTLVAIATANGINDTNHIQFPFAKTETAFGEKNIRNRLLGLPDEVKNIVRTYKPWKENGNLDLWGLGSLANVDKHRYLIPFGMAGAASAISCFTATGGISMLSTPGNLLEGVPFALLAPGGGFQPWPNFSLGVGAQIVFDHPIEVFALKEAAPVLEGLTQIGSDIVEELSTHCFGG